ncbi:MAG: thioredoxin [Betaproteobacteria bacterium]|nr:thioredoxin [Betaproteobacteria bacterium]
MKSAVISQATRLPALSNVFMTMKLFLLLLLLVPAAPAKAAEPGEFAIDIPRWFSETFLDLREDATDAARDGKRLLAYFGQDGCPYCRQLMQTNFSQKPIVDKTRRHFVAIALNIWGDREVTWIDGRTYSEKAFAAHLKVQFTPTLLFLDERGRIVARLNGYYPPHRFEPVLDYVANRLENRVALSEHLKSASKEAASATLHEEPFLLKPPYDLRRHAKKPLAVLFETRYCAACDQLHREGFRRGEIRSLLPRFDIARFELSDRSPVVTPSGGRTTAEQWARSLGIAYTPSLLFFGADGVEVFRVEAYVRPFHLGSALEYVSSGAYRQEPSFQRFIQARARAMRERGEAVDLWE